MSALLCQVPWDLSVTSPTLATRIVCFSEKQPFIHAAAPALVKRECLELRGLEEASEIGS